MPKSKVFQKDVIPDLIISTLIYSVVLGFFADYTNLINTPSYSTTFLTAVVMSLLVYPTFELKKYLAKHFRERGNKTLMVLSVWAVMFVSKFVFLWVLDIIFGEYLEIRGFVSILLIVMIATVLQMAFERFTREK